MMLNRKKWRFRTAEDVSEINKEIRKHIKEAKSINQLTVLVGKSSYLYTQTFNPVRREEMSDLDAVRHRIKVEHSITINEANRRAKKLGYKGNYRNRFSKTR